MITSFSVSTLFKRDEFYLHSLSLFLSIFSLSTRILFLLSRSFLSSISLLLLLSFFFVLFFYETLHLHFPRHVETFFACKLLVSLALALSSTLSSRTFTFSVRTFETTREPTSFSPISLSIRQRILHATSLSFVPSSFQLINSSRLVLHLVLILHADRGKQVNVNPFCMHRSSNRVLLSRE